MASDNYSIKVFNEGDNLDGMVTIESETVYYALMGVDKVNGSVVGGLQLDYDATGVEENFIREEMDNIGKSLLRINKLINKKS